MTLLSKCGVAVTLTMMMFEATALNNVDKYHMPNSAVSVDESNDTKRMVAYYQTTKYNQ